MDLRQKLFKRFALVLFGVFVINTIFFLYWYQSMYWFDNFMHFGEEWLEDYFCLGFSFHFMDNYLKRKFCKKLF